MSSPIVSTETRLLMSNGLHIPQIQLGVYCTSGKETTNAVTAALESNYQGFDSAQMYNNERQTGQAISAFLASPANTKGLSREDIFYTSKLSSNTTYDRARRSISKSVKDCGLGYIDLFLLHSPYGGKEMRLDSWRAIMDAIDDGEIKTGGVSNYGVKHIKELLATKPRIKPAVNQVEVHPFNTQQEIVDFCKANDIIVEAYAPLARAMRMRDPTVTSLSKKYSCSPAQLLVRWSIQQGYVALPKSRDKTRIASNADIGGFQVEASDMAKLTSLHEGLVTDWDPTDAD